MSTRVTQAGAEVVQTVDNATRATQVGAESVYSTPNNGRVTQVGVEFIYTAGGVAAGTPAFRVVLFG